MSEIVTIGGSPTLFSRSAAVLRYAGEFLNGQGFSTYYRSSENKLENG